MDLTTQEIESLTMLAKPDQRSVAPEIANRLFELGLVERKLGKWLVTSRGHAAILRAAEADPPDTP